MMRNPTDLEMVGECMVNISVRWPDVNTVEVIRGTRANDPRLPETGRNC